MNKKLRQRSAASMARQKKLRHGRKHETETVVKDKIQDIVIKNEDENVGTESLKEGIKDAGKVTENMTDDLIRSNPVSKMIQKNKIKRSYYSKDKKAVRTLFTKSGESVEKLSTVMSSMMQKLGDYISKNPKILIILMSASAVAVVLSAMLTSCTLLVSSSGNTTSATSFTAYDEDILAVEKMYRDKERELNEKIEKIEDDYPEYDEYEYFLDEIGHDPYEFASYLTVKYEDYKKRYVKTDVEEFFGKQYELKMIPRTETRTRIVTKTETGEDGSTYETEVEEEYTVNILKVSLENKSLGSVVAEKGLDADEQNRYDLLLMTKGNKEYLFTDIYQDVDPEEYSIPGEALSDQQFARMIAVGEQYLGKKYVWGGNDPDTGFDCSGFVSWVLNHSGWDIGRRGAGGLRNLCTIIPESEARPGDLIFFQGTYDVVGASHVGIYVGNGMMLHCGNPIQYTSIETRYWKNHFYGYGRLPEQ